MYEGIINKAIILIYADGYTEDVDIEEDVNKHIEYYKKIKDKSPFFNSICPNFQYDSGLHFDVDLTLVKNGVIAILNNSIHEITKKEETIPEFVCFIPKEFKANNFQQISKFLEIIENDSSLENKKEKKFVFLKGPKDLIINFIYYDEISYDDTVEELKKYIKIERRDENGKFQRR